MPGPTSTAPAPTTNASPGTPTVPSTSVAGSPTTRRPSTSSGSSSTLAELAAALPAATDPGPRWGTDTGDGVPSGALPKTGSSLDKLATAGGLAALGGIAVVVAARERDQRRAAEGVDPDGPAQ